MNNIFNHSQLLWVGFIAYLILMMGLNNSVFSLPFFFISSIVLFSLPGYVMYSKISKEISAVNIAISTVLGISVTVSMYAIFRYYEADILFLVSLLILVIWGLCLFVKNFKKSNFFPANDNSHCFSVAAISFGLFGVFVLGISFYLSGRISEEGLFFHGPMSRDHIYHLALIQRLFEYIPPDNFVFSGAESLTYHFFPDLTQVLISSFLFEIDILDIYFRLYPSLIFFLLGFFAFWTCATIFNSKKIGLLGGVLILFCGDFSSILGFFQSITTISEFSDVFSNMFASWWQWGSFGNTYPLVHRPAFYHGMLLFLCGLSIIAQRIDRLSHWVLGGFIWGLMAGFNYTFAGIIGAAVAISACVFALKKSAMETQRLSLAALFILIGSIPVHLLFFVSNLSTKGMEKGMPIIWAPSEFSVNRYGGLFDSYISGFLLTLFATGFLLLVAYGIKIAGFRNLIFFRFEFEKSSQPLATIFSITIFISLTIGIFFKMDTPGGSSNNIIFLQPTAFLLTFFALKPLFFWFKKQKPLISRGVYILFIIGSLQAFLSYNLGYKVHISHDDIDAFNWIKQHANRDDVIAFLPQSISSESVLSQAPKVNNFFVSAFTGLRSYYTSEGYSKMYLQGTYENSEYIERLKLVENFQQNVLQPIDIIKLRKDEVRWIMLPIQKNFYSNEIPIVYSNNSISVFEIK